MQTNKTVLCFSLYRSLYIHFVYIPIYTWVPMTNFGVTQPSARSHERSWYRVAPVLCIRLLGLIVTRTPVCIIPPPPPPPEATTRWLAPLPQRGVLAKQRCGREPSPVRIRVFDVRHPFNDVHKNEPRKKRSPQPLRALDALYGRWLTRAIQLSVWTINSGRV